MQEAFKEKSSLDLPKSIKGKLSLQFIVAGFLVWYVLGQYLPQLQFHGMAMLNYGIMLGGVHVVDRFILTKIDFQDNILRNPIAVSIVFFGHCFLIAAAYLFAAMPFFR